MPIGILVLGVLFIILNFVLSGVKRGLRSMISLFIVLCLGIYIMIPLIVELSVGTSSILGIVFAACGLAILMYGTHGVNAVTSTALAGAIAGIVTSSLLGLVLVNASGVSGSAIFTEGTLNLLLAGVAFGVIGVAEGAVRAQAQYVAMLQVKEPDLSRIKVFKNALVAGRERVAELSHTLILVHFGATLPLVLIYFRVSVAGMGAFFGDEMVTTVLFEILIGSIALLLAMLLTTLFAVFAFIRSDRGGIEAWRAPLQDTVS